MWIKTPKGYVNVGMTDVIQKTDNFINFYRCDPESGKHSVIMNLPYDDNATAQKDFEAIGKLLHIVDIQSAKKDGYVA